MLRTTPNAGCSALLFVSRALLQAGASSIAHFAERLCNFGGDARIVQRKVYVRIK